MSARKRGKRCRDGPAARGHAFRLPIVSRKGRKKKVKQRESKNCGPRWGRKKGHWVGKEKKTELNGRPNEPFCGLLDFNSCYYWNAWPTRATGRLFFLFYRFNRRPCPQREGSARENRDTGGIRLLAWGTWDPLDHPTYTLRWLPWAPWASQ